MILRRTCRSLVVAVSAVALISGCKLWDLMGMAHVVNDSTPNTPGEFALWGWPFVNAWVKDSALVQGDTETVGGAVFIAPWTPKSQPVGVLPDSARSLASSDTTVVSVNGLVITARAAGAATLYLQGAYGGYNVEGTIPITVRVKR